MRSNVLAYLALVSSLISFCLGRWAFNDDGEFFAFGVFSLVAGMMTIQSPQNDKEN